MKSVFENNEPIFSPINCSVEEFNKKDIQLLKTTLNTRASLEDIQEKLLYLNANFSSFLSGYIEPINREINFQVECIENVVREYFSHNKIKRLELAEAEIVLKKRMPRFERTDIPAELNYSGTKSPVTIFEEGSPEFSKLEYLYETDQLPDGFKYVPFGEEIIVSPKIKATEKA